MRAVEIGPTSPFEDYSKSFGDGRVGGRASEGVSAVVHAIWVGGLHFGGHVGGWTIDISDGGVTVALATLGSYRGRVRDNCGDFLDQEICGQTDQTACPS